MELLEGAQAGTLGFGIAFYIEKKKAHIQNESDLKNCA